MLFRSIAATFDIEDTEAERSLVEVEIKAKQEHEIALKEKQYAQETAFYRRKLGEAPDERRSQEAGGR